ncbi:MAG: hypothetical protein AAF702_21485 [Chloroflexota bacterium]
MNQKFPEILDGPDESIRDVFESLRNDIIQTATPSQIGDLFERAAKEDVTEIDKLRELFFEITDWYRRQRQWFDNLGYLNYKLFAMLVALFQQMKLRIDLYDVEELYYVLVHRIRSTPGMDNEYAFIDPHRIGIEDLLNKLGISVPQTGLKVPRFDNRVVLQNVLEQVHNHHRLLWMAETVLNDMLNDDSVPIPFDGAPAILANLVGEIGIWRKRHFVKIIDAHVSTIPELAPYFMEPLSRYPQHHDFMLSIIRDWIADIDRSTIQFDAPTIPFLATTHTVSMIYGSIYEQVNLLHIETDIRQFSTPKPQHTLTQLRQILTDLVEKCGQFEYDADIQRKLLVTQLSENIDRAVDSLNIQGDQDVIDALKLDIFKENFSLVNQELVRYLIAWTETSLSVLLEAVLLVAQYYPREMAELVNEWIKRELTGNQDDAEELEVEHDIESILKSNEDLSVNVNLEHAEWRRNLKKKRILNNHVWRIAIAAANWLFLSRTLTQFQSQISFSDHSAIDAESDNAIQDKHEHPVLIGEDIESVEPSASQHEAGMFNERHTPTIDDKDRKSNSTFEEGDKSSEVQSLPRTDEKIADRDPIADEPISQKEITKASEINSIEVERFLASFLDLLPAMLQSSEYNLNINFFVHNLAMGHEMQMYYGKEGIGSFTNDIEMLLTAPPIDVALFALQEWYGIVESIPESKAAWVSAVYPALLKLVTDAPSNLRHILRDAFFAQQWVDSRHSDLRKIARAIIARSYVLDGTVVDLPLSRYGVLLLDVSNEVWQDYHQQVFKIAQRLSMLTPIQIYPMGTSHISYSIGSNNDVSETQLVNSDDLRLRRTYNRLIMPFFEQSNRNSQYLQNESALVHFVLILRPIESIFQDLPGGDAYKQHDILDLSDLIDLSTTHIMDKSGRSVWDPFATEQELSKPEQYTKFIEWPWQGRLILLSMDKPSLLHNLRSAIAQSGFIGDESDLNYIIEDLFKIVNLSSRRVNYDDQLNIERFIEQQIIDSLHKLSQNEWWHNLEKYRLLPDVVDTDGFSAVIECLNQWVQQLHVVSDDVLHPRDISLTISWSILALSRQNLQIALNTVVKWLESSEELEIYMGIACTRVLFNFYRSRIIATNDSLSNYDELLQLFPPLMNLDRGYSEFGQIIETLLDTTYSTEWTERLIGMSEKSEFLEGIRLVSSKEDIRWILDTITYEETSLGFIVLFGQIELELQQFKLIMVRLIQRLEKNGLFSTSQEREDFARSLPYKVSVNQLAELEILCCSDAFIRYPEQVIRRFSHESHEVTKHTLTLYQVYYQNIQRVADTVRLQLYTKLEGTLPALSEGKRYGVVIVDITSRSNTMSTTALAFIRNFQKLLQDNETVKSEIVFIVHHVGRSQVVFSDQRREPKLSDLRPAGIHNNVSIVGPTLERYQPELLEFVLILTSQPILDLADWAEQREWSSLFWMHTPRRSWTLNLDQSTVRGAVGKKHIDELTKEIMLKMR